MPIANTSWFFQKYSVVPSDMLVIACSGGADSMLLLAETLAIHPKDRTIVAHFNHRLRGAESDGDEAFVRDFCEKRGIVLEVGWSDIAEDAREMKTGIEEAARTKRYAFLEEVRKRHGARYILTAHHLDDSIETLVFNLVRGTRLGGLAGIPEQNGSILRPLLALSKNEILQSLGDQSIPFRTDSSNVDTSYLRNRIRANILPEFATINPEYRSSIASFMAYTRELQDFIDHQVRAFLGTRESFLVQDFERLGAFLQREVIRYIYSLANQGTIGLSEGNIAEVLRYIQEASGGTEKIIKKMRLTKRGGQLFFEKIVDKI